ncbi:hypothetical protein SAMN05414139_10148 [Burkholderia sp. D7]|nr:hypothetical protein SAMN05414139_10148 [Burkholderia sp. D7]
MLAKTTASIAAAKVRPDTLREPVPGCQLRPSNRHLVCTIANIASPTSVRNVGVNPRVCVSFIDVFIQKVFKFIGTAWNIRRQDANFSNWSAPLEAKTGPRFSIHSVLVIRTSKVAPILAPSYRLYAVQATEAAQVESVMRTCGVRPT